MRRSLKRLEHLSFVCVSMMCVCVCVVASKFVQVHVVMNDGPGLTDEFESLMSAKEGVGEIEVLSMGLL